MYKIYQWIWFNIAKRFTQRKAPGYHGILLDAYVSRFRAQLKLAFGKQKLVILGDSNGEEMADYESMIMFPELSINLSIGGTRADHWADFFKFSKDGRDIYEQIKNCKILINVGGNNVLQGMESALHPSLYVLCNLFPNAYWINIPSVYAGLIAQITNRSEADLVKELQKANDLIGTVARDKLIDIRPFTGNDESMPFFYVLKDLVHYSDIFDKIIRIPLIKKVIYG